jgi:3-hydroxyacyl-CoA dehydrogenase/enoyl-CoA hydratase/3-hydroxybutyryl-CoA epimerase
MPFFHSENVVVDIDGDLALLKLDVAGRSVNVFTRQVMLDLNAALDRLAERSNLRIVVIRGMKKSGFVAGADIQQFAEIKNAQEAIAISAAGQQLFDKLELLPMATIAIIHGPCLGGGLEIALGCDYRLVVDTPSTQLGLPEVELGLLPGWGGTQRLPRVVGLERALKIILGGKRLNAVEAFQWGLADGLARSESELAAQRDVLLERARSRGKQRRHGLPLSTWRQWAFESTGLGRGAILRAARKMIDRRVWDDFPAPAEALEAIRTGLKQGMQAGLAFEREAASRLALSPACRNLVNVFLQRERARKPAGVHGEPISRIGVVGAGTMGAGIAQLAAIRGCEVVVQEMDAEALGRGILKITELFNKALERGVLTPIEYERRLGAIKGTTSWEGFQNVELVVEAVLEEPALKKKVFEQLEQQTRPETVLATNTSSLSVTDLQTGLRHPERVAGLHFFNPVHKMDLVEVVRAPATNDASMKLLTRFTLALGKTPIRVGDGPGFVVNRVLIPYLNEALLLVNEGMDIDEVDGLMRRFGMPMGPLQLLDQIGLDVAAHVADSMQPRLGEGRAPNQVFRRLSESGWLGQKSGSGFYRYRGKKARVNKDVLPLVRSDAAPSTMQHLPAAVKRQQARERLVLLMVNESAACLGEGLAGSAQDIDLALILGTGWAPHRGGPLHYADTFGLTKAVETLAEFAQRVGLRYQPCEELRRRASRGEVFYNEHVVV